MKTFLACFTLSVALAAVSAAAASLDIQQTGNAWAVYLNGEDRNGNFNVVDVRLVPRFGGAFENVDSGYDGFTPRNPGDPFTFMSPYIQMSTAQGGLGYTALGIFTTPSLVAYAASPLGQQIDTTAAPGGRLFLANVFLPGPFEARVELYGNGLLLESLLAEIPIPEPGCMPLAAMALTVAAVARRRRPA